MWVQNQAHPATAFLMAYNIDTGLYIHLKGDNKYD
jgi:hypothetical protein